MLLFFEWFFKLKLIFFIGVFGLTEAQTSPSVLNKPIPLSVSRTPKADDPIIIVGSIIFLYYL